MNREYVKRILSNREQFENIKLGYTDTYKINNIVLNFLNLNSMFELRDRFEGEVFLNTFSVKVKGAIALEKFLEIELIDWDNLTPNNYSSNLSKIGLEIDIISSDNGSFPIVERNSVRPAIIINIVGTNNLWICGYASVDVLNNNQSDRFYSGMMNRETKTAFIGYDKLVKFKSIQELFKLK